MDGWHISVFRQKDGGAQAATFESQQGPRIAVWQAKLLGLNWLNELVKDGKARFLGGDGYPMRYTATAAGLLPRILDGPPMAREVWISGAGDILTDKWVGRTLIDHDEASKCAGDEWLLVVAWDES
jgi:hypothetical protein